MMAESISAEPCSPPSVQGLPSSPVTGNTYLNITVLMLLTEVSYDHQACIYLIKNTVILGNIITI